MEEPTPVTSLFTVMSKMLNLETSVGCQSQSNFATT